MKQDTFRFEDLEVWKRAAAITGTLFDLADRLDERKWYRVAEQMRAATLSITNNIAEGSGSASKVDFRNFLNMARRSVFEVANMLIILRNHGRLAEAEVAPLLVELEEESKMLRSFMATLVA